MVTVLLLCVIRGRNGVPAKHPVSLSAPSYELPDDRIGRHDC